MPGEARRWRLAGSNGWGAALPTGDAGARLRVEAEGLRLGRERLTLAARAGGPASPEGIPASLGSLTLPTNVHADGGEVLVAASRRRRILRLDPASGELRSWIGLGPLGEGGRRLGPIALTRVGALLVVAERGRSRILALHPGGPAVLDAVSLPGRTVQDLVPAGDARVLILARLPDGPAEVWCWRPGSAAPRRVETVPSPGTPPEVDPQRLVRDAAGRPYVFDAAGDRLLGLPFHPQPTQWRPRLELMDLFDPVPLVIEPDPTHGWRMRIPPAGVGPPFPWPAPATWRAYDPEGRPLLLQPDAPVGPPPFVAGGTLTVGPLNGAIPRFVWDRVEVEIARLPEGTAIELRTRTSDDSAEPDDRYAEWSARSRITTLPAAASERKPDFAVLSPPGRYLWIRVRLEGGNGSPELSSLTAAGPRGGLIDFLPLVFREADQDSRFLERFVGALERSWEPLERAVADFDRELRAETASSAMLDYLASWFDEPIQPEWSVPARRHTVRHAGRYLFRRGTPEGVRAALRLFLANRWGVAPEALQETPFLWEHFRSRLPLHAGPEGATGAGVGRLFGSEVLQRLRLGSSAVGTGTLRDVGSPETDHVTLDAYRYSVFLPRALLPTEEDLRRFRDVLVREQPVHAMAEVVLVEPRFRLGAQSTLGVDSLLGVYPTARLGSGCQPDEEGGTRLDYDSLLAGSDPEQKPGLSRLDRDGATLPWRIT